jgi:hypothetical protein
MLKTRKALYNAAGPGQEEKTAYNKTTEKDRVSG